MAPVAKRRAIFEQASFMKFAPLAEGSRSDVVARRLSDVIKLGLIDDGEQLPSEADLAAQLGVATVTLREALATLREEGLIETRRGRTGGSFVRLPRATGLADVRAGLRALSADQLRDFGDYRTAVAGASASLAASRASRHELKRLTQRSAELSADRRLAGRRRADTRFHIEMAAVSHSTRLTQAEMAVQAEMGEMLPLLLAENSELERAVEQHAAIVAAIADRDDGRARRLAEAHVAADTAHLIELHMRLATGEDL